MSYIHTDVCVGILVLYLAMFKNSSVRRTEPWRFSRAAGLISDPVYGAWVAIARHKYKIRTKSTQFDQYFESVQFEFVK